jgi:hypothetical protein
VAEAVEKGDETIQQKVVSKRKMEAPVFCSKKKGSCPHRHSLSRTKAKSQMLLGQHVVCIVFSQLYFPTCPRKFSNDNEIVGRHCWLKTRHLLVVVSFCSIFSYKAVTKPTNSHEAAPLWWS